MNPVLLDISRSISRAPHPVPTGIDRVERAYIEHFLNADRQVWFLSRIAGGFALLDKAGMALVYPMILGDQPWGSKDLIARLFGRKKPEMTQRAESEIRRISVANGGKNNLSAMLQRHLSSGFSYVNIGHSNRKAGIWKTVRDGGAKRCIAMIHDVIPLDFPQYSRPDIVTRFEQELHATAKNCEYLIYNSEHTATCTEEWLQKWGVKVNSVTSLLGVTPLPSGFERKPDPQPYFVTLGTIEPRKNHMLLLKIWQNLGQIQPAGTLPDLHIVGRRGWLNQDVFDILDQSPMMGKTVFEHNTLDDAGLSELLSGARGLLFPSFAEGYGYPLVEALQKKIPVICSNLPCFQEISGDLPTYLDPRDEKGWENAILRFSESKINVVDTNQLDFSSWEQHFRNIDTIF